MIEVPIKLITVVLDFDIRDPCLHHSKFCTHPFLIPYLIFIA
jgi:hypothetical protein